MKVVTIVRSHILLASVVCILSGCYSISETPKSQTTEVAIATPLPSGTSASVSQHSPIRTIDFSNFNYPVPEEFIDPDRTQTMFTLRRGQLPATRDKYGIITKMGVSLASIGYGDVTGDGGEETIIVLSIQTGGSALPNVVYVYTWRDERPFLLWSFVTGDRADGGLRRVRAENGKLLLELYSPIDKKGDCCPAYFKRTRFIWRSSQFRQEGEEETLPNPDGHGSPVLPPY